MKVYIDRNNIHVELIRFRKNSNFIAVGLFELENFRDRCVYEIGLIAIREVSPPFGEEPWTWLEMRGVVVKQGLSFICFSS